MVKFESLPLPLLFWGVGWWEIFPYFRDKFQNFPLFCVSSLKDDRSKTTNRSEMMDQRIKYDWWKNHRSQIIQSPLIQKPASCGISTQLRQLHTGPWRHPLSTLFTSLSHLYDRWYITHSAHHLVSITIAATACVTMEATPWNLLSVTEFKTLQVPKSPPVSQIWFPEAIVNSVRLEIVQFP